MPLPETISRLRKQHHVTQEPLSDALFSLSGVTRLIITHQPDASFLSRCDGIVVMKKRPHRRTGRLFPADESKRNFLFPFYLVPIRRKKTAWPSFFEGHAVFAIF